jgi:FAD/FMN-containing dehydrogenase
MYSTFATVEKELLSTIDGDVWFDVAKRNEYSTATCMYKVMPIGVVAPKWIGDVQRVVRLCAENGIAVIARGGASGLVGQAVGFGIILDFTKHMNHVVKISEETSSVTVEAGCILNDVDNLLRSMGKTYPIDPQSAKICTIGGTIATNAAGSHGLRYGSTKNHIKNLTVVLSNGDAAVLNPNELENRLTPEAQSRFLSAKEILARNHDIIKSHAPAVEKYSSGYNVFESLHDNNFDATRLICGSEGTLAIVTEATMNVCPLPKSIVAAVAYFNSYNDTAEAIPIVRNFSPAAIELLDKSYTDVGVGLSTTSDRFIGKDFQTMLLIEFEGEDDDSIRRQMRQLHDALQRAEFLLDWADLRTEAERQSIWMLRETVSEKLNHMPSQQRKVSTIEDGAVPLHNLPAYIKGLNTILGKYSIPFTLYGHAGMGHIHCTTLVEIETQSGKDRIEGATLEVFDLIMKLDGTLSAEHGDGFVRTPFLERAFGREVYGIFKEIKQVLDPQNILNPQKIIGTQDRLFLHDIKYV